MPTDQQSIIPFVSLLNIGSFWFLVGAMLFILAVLHFVFTLFVVRQVQLMTDTVMTEVSPLLRAMSIIYAGLGLGIVVLLLGLLF